MIHFENHPPLVGVCFHVGSLLLLLTHILLLDILINFCYSNQNFLFQLGLISNHSFIHVFCRDQLEIEKRRRTIIEREKADIEHEKQKLMMKLYQYEETTKKAERGKTLD